MNEDINASDPLEEELRVLQPRGLSVGFTDSLRKRLERTAPHDDRPKPRRPDMFKWFAPSVAVAALVLVALGVVRNWPFHEPHRSSNEEIVSPAVAPPEEQPDELPKPTLTAFNRAIGNQPGSLEELLDFHARTLLPNVPGPDPVDVQWP